MIKNNKGMTMIELVVVMLISVILMGIAGSILLSSTGFFTKTTITNQDKLATDKIVEFVDGEIMYATNVIVSEKEPKFLEEIKSNNWHYFLFEKGRVYIGTVFYDGNANMYRNSEAVEPLSESYYSNRNLAVEAKGYSNSYRLDLTFSFNNQDGDTEYKTKSTIAFPNLKLQYDSETTKKGWFDSVEYNSANWATSFYIYYTKDAIDMKTEEKISGTVADYFNACKEPYGNCKDWGEWTATGKTEYSLGDFVKVTKGNKVVWYRRAISYKDSNSEPGKDNKEWVEIYTEGTEPGKEGIYDKNSIYRQGDVVRYIDGTFETDFIYFSVKELQGKRAYPNADYEDRYWAPVYIDTYRDASAFCDVLLLDQKKNTYTYVNHTYIYYSPYGKLYPNAQIAEIGSKIKDVSINSSFSIKSAYSVDDKLTSEYIVKDGEDYYIYMGTDSNRNGTITVDKNNLPSNDKTKSWQKLQVLWDQNSYYKTNDVILYGDKFYQAKIDVSGGVAPNPQYDNEYWKKVYWNTKERKWWSQS